MSYVPDPELEARRAAWAERTATMPRLPREKRKRTDYTKRAQVRLEAGLHPLMGAPIDLNPDHRCGNCLHLVAHRHDRTWWKCELRASGGEATDVRKKWPACPKWEMTPEEEQ